MRKLIHAVSALALVAFAFPALAGDAEDLTKFLSDEVTNMQTALSQSDTDMPMVSDFPMKAMATRAQADFKIGGGSLWFKAGVSITPEVELIFEHQ